MSLTNRWIRGVNHFVMPGTQRQDLSLLPTFNRTVPNINIPFGIMADIKADDSDSGTLPALDPTVLLISAKEVVRRLSISGRTWYVLVTTQHAPQPIRLGKRTLWRVEELEEWVRDGCPPLDRWQRMKDLPLRAPSKLPRKRVPISGI